MFRVVPEPALSAVVAKSGRARQQRLISRYLDRIWILGSFETERDLVFNQDPDAVVQADRRENLRDNDEYNVTRSRRTGKGPGQERSVLSN